MQMCMHEDTEHRWQPWLPLLSQTANSGVSALEYAKRWSAHQGHDEPDTDHDQQPHAQTGMLHHIPQTHTHLQSDTGASLQVKLDSMPVIQKQQSIIACRPENGCNTQLQTFCRRGHPPLCSSPCLPVAAPATLCGCPLQLPPALPLPHPAELRFMLSSTVILPCLLAVDTQVAAAAAATAAGNADSGSMSAGRTAPFAVMAPLQQHSAGSPLNPF